MRRRPRATPAEAALLLSPRWCWQDGDTALITACSEGHLEVVRLLLDSRADPNAARKVSGHTPPPHSPFPFALRPMHAHFSQHQGWPRRGEAWTRASRLAEAQESAPHASRLRRLGFCIVSREQEGYKSVP